MEDYSDIINLPHHRSVSRAGMSRLDRAAQFSSFAALTGYEEGIAEAARLTDSRPERSEEEMRRLDRALALLEKRQGERPEISLLVFLPDERKAGGSLVRRKAVLRRVDNTERRLIFTDRSSLAFDDIYGLEAELLEKEG